MVLRSHIARFLRCDVAEVQRMIEMDDLPFMEKPDPAKPGVRIFLPDFHVWSIAKASHNSTKLRNYEEFKKAFFRAQEPRAE
jgi:hypothetical protein